MIGFIRQHIPLFTLMMLWLVVTVFAGPLLYLVLPVSVFLMRRSELWSDMVFGFIMVLIVSDMNPGIVAMRVVKTAKYTYIIALSLIYLMEQARMQPQSAIFTVFTPFFVYALIPIVRSGEALVSIQKTISYALLYLVVPNYVLHNFRLRGWDFFKDLIHFLVFVLITQRLLPFVGPTWWSYVDGRFRGYFGNPNGLAIFSYLTFILFSVVNYMKKDLFSLTSKVIIYGIIVYFLILCGSRTSLMSTLMFVIFLRFFSVSPFIGLIAFVAFLGGAELVSNNLPAIVTALGLQDYLRVDTLEDGSGRYFAWQFAWNKINDGGFFLLGGGFGNDEYVMRANYDYLKGMGHQGGVHNSYLTLWFNVGVLGLLVYLRSFILIFFKANKRVPIAFAIMFSILFSVLYESWLTGSLNPFTILLIIIITMITEDDIVEWESKAEEAERGEELRAPEEEVPRLILPAR